MNNVQLMGNLVADPERIETKSDTLMCRASIAHNRRWKKNGALQEETSFFDIIAFDKTATILLDHFKKGRQILVDARLRQDRWEDRETGANRSKVVLIVSRVHFTGRKADNEGPDNDADEQADLDL